MRHVTKSNRNNNKDNNKRNNKGNNNYKDYKDIRKDKNQ